MARIWLIKDEDMNRTISHLPGVIGAVRTQAEAIGIKAEARLERVHTPERESKVTVTFGDVDAFVNLEDPDNAMAIEFGHFLHVNGRETNHFILGKYIITGAAGLV